MKLHRKNNYINYAPEEKPKGARVKKQLSRGVYFTVLFFLVFSAAKYFYEKEFTVKGHGLVTMDIHQIKAIDDIVINSFSVSKNDLVDPGDTLFRMRLYKAYHGLFSIDPLLSERISRADRDIALKHSEIRFTREETRQLTYYLQQVRKRYLLEMETFTEISEVKNQLLKRENHINQLENDIAVLREYRQRLQANAFSSYVSPLKGYVLEMYQKPYATVKGDDPIIDIALPGTMRIKGFFQQDSHKHVRAGKEVQIVFPDGYRVKGEIVNRHALTQLLPEIFLDANEPARSYIVVDIVPFELDPQIWSQYNMLSVELILKR